MIQIQLYKVINYKNGNYIVNLYSSMYCIVPVTVRVSRWKFYNWAIDKLDKSELDGDKVKLHKLRNKAKKVHKQKKVISITEKEKEIMNIVYKQILNNNYIIEKDIIIDKCSNAFVQRTIKNKSILDAYKLKRVRVNKNIKEKLGITKKGYPFILVRGDYYGK